MNGDKVNEINGEHHIQVKDIELSIDRMLKRASGQKDLTVKRDGL